METQEEEEEEEGIMITKDNNYRRLLSVDLQQLLETGFYPLIR